MFSKHYLNKFKEITFASFDIITSNKVEGDDKIST